MAVRTGLAYGEQPLQRLDLYQPESGPPAPVLVAFWHGGAWKEGSRAEAAGLGAHLAAAGYALATLDYRLGPDDLWPAQGEDAAAGVAWLWARRAELWLDGARLVLAGHSAGAHLAALLTFDASWLPAEVEVAGLVGLSGVYSLEAVASRRWMRANLLDAAFPHDPEVYRTGSPLNYVRAVPARIWLSNVEVDWGLYRHTAWMREALEAVGKEVETSTQPERHHLDQMEHLGRADDETTRRFVEFCRRVAEGSS